MASQGQTKPTISGDDFQQGAATASQAAKTVIPLEVLFSSPILLKFNKACDFLIACHDATKKGASKAIFKRNVDNIAKRHQILSAGNDWKDVIDENEESSTEKNHFKIITTFINDDGCPRKKPVVVYVNSVTSLLGVIRNKRSHGALLADNLKILGWDKTNSKGVELCDEKFMAYWTIRFPNLLPFLWEQYKEYLLEKNPGGAYPSFFKSQYLTCTLNDPKTTYAEQLSTALLLNFEQGWLEDRYSFGTRNTLTLEYRSLETCFLHVNKRCFVEIEISRTEKQESTELKIISRWYSIEEDKTILTCHERVTNMTYDKLNQWKGMFLGRIIICNKLSDLKCYFTTNKRKNIVSSNDKFVIFTDREHQLVEEEKKDILDKFSEVLQQDYESIPAKWSDLTPTIQNEVLAHSSIKIQDACLKLEDFMKIDLQNVILLNLQGKDLNKMLKQKTIVISTVDIVKPAISDEMYISRMLHNRGTVGSGFFALWASTSQYSNIFIIINGEGQAVFSSKGLKFQTIRTLKDFKNVKIYDCKSNLFCVKDEIQNFLEECNCLKELIMDNNIHIFKHINNDEFEWVFTHGLYSNIADSLYKESIKGAIGQEKFLSNILESQKSQELLFICDEPGTGKTELLMNFSKKLTEKGKIVLLFEMQDIVERITNNATKVQIINTIVDISFSENFGKKIFAHLLQSGTSSGIEFEIMIDGINEVKAGHKHLVLEILKIFKKEIPSIRVWVTSTDCMLEEIREELGVLGSKFIPFSNDDRFKFFTNFWSESWLIRNGSNAKNCPSDDVLAYNANLLLEKCISNDNANLVDNPFQCKMLGEICDNNVLTDTLFQNIRTFCLQDVFKQLFDKIFDVCLHDKLKLPRVSGNTTPETYRKRITRFHVYLSIKHMFSDEKANELKPYLEIPRRKLDFEELQRDSSKLGIIQSFKPLRFTCRTYLEYLLAEFVAEEVKDCMEDEKSLEAMNEVFKSFILKDVLAIRETGFIRKFQHENLAGLLNMTLKGVLSNAQNIFEESGNVSLFNKLTEMFENRCNRTFVSLKSDSLASRHITQFKCAILKKQYYIIKLLILESVYPLHPFVFALSTQQFDIVDFIIKEMNFGPEQWHKVQDYDESKSGILHRVVQFCFSLNNFSFEDITNKCSLFLRYAVEQKRSLLEERDSNGRTPFLMAIDFVTQIADAVHVANIKSSGNKLPYLNFGKDFNLLENHNGRKNIKENSLHRRMAHMSENIDNFSSDSQNSNCHNSNSHNSNSQRKADHCETEIERSDFFEEYYEKPCKYYDKVVNLLVSLGSDINATDNVRNTALHIQFAQHNTLSRKYFDGNRHNKIFRLFLGRAHNLAQLNMFNNTRNTPVLEFLDDCKSIFPKLTSRNKSSLRKLFDIFKEFGADFSVHDNVHNENLLDKAKRRDYPKFLIELMNKSLISISEISLDTDRDLQDLEEDSEEIQRSCWNGLFCFTN